MKYLGIILSILFFNNVNNLVIDGEKPLLIGSFNIQSLGPTKIARPEFVSNVIKILSRYDIVLIQEIKDSSENNEKVFQVLMDALNDLVKADGVKYDFVISPRLGKSTYKEQMAYLYKNSLNNKDDSRKIAVTNSYVYNDVDLIYDRSPYIAQFKIENTDLPVKEFSMLNLHLKPANVLDESMELRKVVDEINIDNDNILIMGDMNFDCRYMSGVKKQKVRDELKEFTFYINDDVSTTTSSELCALDRILISGEAFKNSVVPNSNQTYLYYKEFGLTLEEAEDISDHYPVEIQFDS